MLQKNLEAGRQADNERRRKMGAFQNGTAVCDAGKLKYSCNEQSMCGVGLGCIASSAWPYVKSCQWLRNSTMPCKEDAEC